MLLYIYLFIYSEDNSMSQRKVYWKALRLFLSATAKYIQRNQLHLQANLTTPQFECVVAVLDAILVCLNALPEDTPT